MDRKNHSGALGLNIDIDKHSGFCYGVIRAIKEAEIHLDNGTRLYSLGAIVHNNKELERLKEKGLQVIEHPQLHSLARETLLIRAHGEPPKTYLQAREQNLTLVDCTCPVVLRLQQKIKEEYYITRAEHRQIAIFGKLGHAEVNGLIGQVQGDALIIEQSEQIDQLDYSRPISLFAQTTQDPEAFIQLCNNIEERYRQTGVNPFTLFRAFNSICKQVAERLPLLQDFSRQHEVVLFVSGKQSSNGRVLFEACLSANPHSYLIESKDDLQAGWFKAGTSVGICGATSTPKWLMEEVALALSMF